MLLLILALSLLQTAALHTVWWGRVLGLLASTIYLCAVGRQSGRGWDALIDLMIIAAALAVLVGLTVLRARRAFSWWEFVVVLVVLTAATVLPTADALVLGLASDAGSYLDFAWNLLLSVGFLAAPVVLAAGYAIAQFAYTGVVWGVDVVRGGVPRWVLLVILIAVVGWRIYAEARAWWDTRLLSAPLILTGLGLLITCWIVWTVLDTVADRVQAGATLPVHLGRDLQRVLVPIAVLLTLDLLLQLLARSPPGYLAQLLADAGQPGAAAAVLAAADGLREVAELLGGRPARLGLALLIMATGIWRAARGDRGTAELLGVLATVLIFALYFGIEPATAYLPLLVVIIIAGLVVVWGIGRALTPHRVEALLVAALLSLVFGSRGFVGRPGFHRAGRQLCRDLRAALGIPDRRARDSAGECRLPAPGPAPRLRRQCVARSGRRRVRGADQQRGQLAGCQRARRPRRPDVRRRVVDRGHGRGGPRRGPR